MSYEEMLNLFNDEIIDKKELLNTLDEMKKTIEDGMDVTSPFHILNFVDSLHMMADVTTAELQSFLIKKILISEKINIEDYVLYETIEKRHLESKMSEILNSYKSKVIDDDKH